MPASPNFLKAFLSAIACCLVLAMPAAADQVTISSTNDGELDEHINWVNSAKGSSPFQDAYLHMFVGRLANDYELPVVGPSKFAAMKFDVSSLAGETLTKATLRLIQTADAAAMPMRPGTQFAPTTEVYGVNSGEDFDEFVTTWTSFTGGQDDSSRDTFIHSDAISSLGTMTNISNPGGLTGPGAVTTFVDADLTTLVQGWIDGTKPNLGLLLLNTATFTGAPLAPNDIVARYAAHESEVFDGPQLILEYGTPTTLDGDFNDDGKVDAADYTVWRDGLNTVYTQEDYDLWKSNFGASNSGSGAQFAGGSQVPEPHAFVLVAIAVSLGWLGIHSRRSRFCPELG